VDLRRAMKEPFHAGVCARVSEFAGRAGGNDALAVFVEHDAPGDNLEDARELVVTITTVRPRMRLSTRIRSSSSTDVTGSSPAEGSSRNMRLGSRAIARAIAARLLMPPDSSEGSLSSSPRSPTRQSFALTMAPMASGFRSVQVTRGRPTFSPTVIEAKRAPDWNTTPKAGRPTSNWRFASPAMTTAPRGARRGLPGSASMSTCRTRWNRELQKSRLG